jgi:hypothetical protein
MCITLATQPVAVSAFIAPGAVKTNFAPGVAFFNFGLTIQSR